MRPLLRRVAFWPWCLAACSAQPLSSPLTQSPGPVAYNVSWITPPDGVLALSALDINEKGQVAGDALGPDGVQEAFTWSPTGGFALLAHVPNASYMEAFAINESGVVAGNAWWSDGNTSRAVIWTDPAHVQEIGVSGAATAMNDRGHVVGYVSPDGGSGIGEAFLWDATKGVTLLGTLGGTWSYANAVNAADEVVGTSELADGTSHAFLWSNGTMTDLGALGGAFSEAAAISDAGVVTGTIQGSTSEIRVYRWTRTDGMVDVGPSYPDVTEGPTSMSTDINAKGQIVGAVLPPGQPLRAAIRQPADETWQELMADWPYGTFALGVNNRGVIVGRVDQSEDFTALPSRAAIWTPVPAVVGAGRDSK